MRTFSLWECENETLQFFCFFLCYAVKSELDESVAGLNISMAGKYFSTHDPSGFVEFCNVVYTVCNYVEDFQVTTVKLITVA